MFYYEPMIEQHQSFVKTHLDHHYQKLLSIYKNKVRYPNQPKFRVSSSKPKKRNQSSNLYMDKIILDRNKNSNNRKKVIKDKNIEYFLNRKKAWKSMDYTKFTLNETFEKKIRDRTKSKNTKNLMKKLQNYSIEQKKFMRREFQSEYARESLLNKYKELKDYPVYKKEFTKKSCFRVSKNFKELFELKKKKRCLQYMQIDN